MSVTFLTNIDRKELEEKIEKAAQSGGNGGGATGSGLTTAQINALHGMFKVCLFDDSKDVDSAIAAFEAAFGLSGGGEEPDIPDVPDVPDVPVVKTYSVSAELINVTSSNKATTVNENASYTTTLTAADGYKLDTVSVLMDGVDVTADVYADGVISISAVTGNVEIVASAIAETKEPELITDGLKAYFDMRNATEEHNPSMDYYAPATQGDGKLYSWAGFINVDEIGDIGGGGTYAASGTTEFSFGKEFTWCTFGKNSGDKGNMLIVPSDYCGTTNGGIVLRGTYAKSDGTKVKIPNVSVESNDTGSYVSCVVRVKDDLAEIFVNGELKASFDGTVYEDFVSWADVFSASCIPYGQGWHVASALYTRALSDVEVVETHSFFKTLEVSA